MRTELNTNDLKFLDKYVPKNNPKFELNGVYMDGENNAIVATDTKALLVLNISHDFDMIVKGGTVKTASRIGTAKNPEEFKLFSYEQGESPSKITYGGFIGAEDIILGKTINGRYPQWKKIVKCIDKETYSVNGEEKFAGEGNERHKLPDMLFIDTHPSMVYHEIAKTDNVVDEAYIKSIVEYCKYESIHEVTLMVGEKERPLQIFCDRFIVVVMPIVY